MTLLHGDLTEGQMQGLYEHDKIKALINIGHGEGFGLPLFEAAYNALPVVSVGWSGQLDFLHHKGKDYFNSVDYSIRNVQQEAVWPGVIEAESKWAYAQPGSYKMVLRRVYKKYTKAKTKAVELKEIIEKNFTSEKMYGQFVNHLLPSGSDNEIIL